jgi:hypothetical protein
MYYSVIGVDGRIYNDYINHYIILLFCGVLLCLHNIVTGGVTSGATDHFLWESG